MQPNLEQAQEVVQKLYLETDRVNKKITALQKTKESLQDQIDGAQRVIDAIAVPVQKEVENKQ